MNRQLFKGTTLLHQNPADIVRLIGSSINIVDDGNHDDHYHFHNFQVPGQ